VKWEDKYSDIDHHKVPWKHTGGSTIQGIKEGREGFWGRRFQKLQGSVK
jgi:hypothetical protein